MKEVLKTTSFCLLALCIAIGGFLVIPLCAQEGGRTYTYGEIISAATLTAVITSPADGSTINVGDCFEVTATIIAGTTQLNVGYNFNASPSVNTVYAIECDIENVTATIAIDGNATTSEATTKDLGTDLDRPSGCANCPTEATVSWLVCCTGPGTVTITVTPAGYSALLVYNNNADWLISPVYASSISPIPEDRLTSDSITIYQKEKEDFSQKLIEEPISPTWARSSDVTTVNTWANTQTAQAGQDVTIYANVANRGDIEGPYTATLKINGVVEDVKTGMLQGNTAVPLKFIVSRNEPGTYRVDVNGQKAYFTVIGETASGGVSSRDAALIVALIIIASLIVVLVVLIIHRRQQYLN